MQINNIFFPISSLGPGRRVVIYTVGCPYSCPGCANPELRRPDASKDRPVSEIAEFIRSICEHHKVDGVTISGGDPLFQLSELIALCKILSFFVPDICVYTGKETEQLTDDELELMKYVYLIITGPYVEALNLSSSALRGSVNQCLCFSPRCPMRKVRLYEHYDREGPQTQNFYLDDGLYSIGIAAKDGG